VYKIVVFTSEKKDGPNILHFFYYFPMSFLLFVELLLTMCEYFSAYLKDAIFEHVRVLRNYNGAQSSWYTYKALRASHYAVRILWTWGRQAQEPPRAAHTLATPLGPAIKQYLSSISISQNSNDVTNIIFTTEYLTGRL